MTSWWWHCAMRMKLIKDPVNRTLVRHHTLSILVRIPLLHGFVRWHPKIMFDHERVSFCTLWKNNHHNIQWKTAHQLFHQRCNCILKMSLTLPPSNYVGETVVPRWQLRMRMHFCWVACSMEHTVYTCDHESNFWNFDQERLRTFTLMVPKVSLLDFLPLFGAP